jgi:hypothetical protein
MHMYVYINGKRKWPQFVFFSAKPTLESGLQGSDQLDHFGPLAGADDTQRNYRRLQDLLHARQLYRRPDR